MWVRRAHLLQPLTTITPEKKTLKWIDVDQKSFNDIENVVACDNLLA